jgi:hypothetical protein
MDKRFTGAAVTRRGALALAAGAAVARLDRSAHGSDPQELRVAYPAAVATLDPAKMRVGGLE